MDLRQRIELRRLIAPELRQSLKILTLSLTDIKTLLEQELETNPLLEESTPENNITTQKISQEPQDSPPSASPATENLAQSSDKFRVSLVKNVNSGTMDMTAQITRKQSLQDILLRQLAMFVASAEELKIGEEIIGNLDDNGYLKTPLEEIAIAAGCPVENVEKTLLLIQQFDPPGVAARSIAECLLIQLKIAGENDPLLIKIIQEHLPEVAKKNYSHIAKAMDTPLENIEQLVKKLLRLDPKPGRNYSAEETQHITPDIIINEVDGDLTITINNEDLPGLNINRDYRKMLKNDTIDPQTKEFLGKKLRDAIELLRAISKRQITLRRVVETVVEYQEEAIKNDLSRLRPLTFAQVAEKLSLHETTVCRVVMNKYVYTPFGVVSLKSFFPGKLKNQNGESVSDSHVKRLIKDIIDREDKKHPLSDREIVKKLITQNNNLKLARRTVTKYREGLRILSSVLRKIR